MTKNILHGRAQVACKTLEVAAWNQSSFMSFSSENNNLPFGRFLVSHAGVKITEWEQNQSYFKNMLFVGKYSRPNDLANLTLHVLGGVMVKPATYNNLHKHKPCSQRFCSRCPPQCHQSTWQHISHPQSLHVHVKYIRNVIEKSFRSCYLALLRSARRVSSSDRLFWRDTGISSPPKLCKS